LGFGDVGAARLYGRIEYHPRPAARLGQHGVDDARNILRLIHKALALEIDHQAALHDHTGRHADALRVG